MYAYDLAVIRRLLPLFVLLTLVACGSDGGGGTTATTEPGETATQNTGPPPWPLGADQAQRILDAGLPHYSAEGSKVHYHAHLDVFYNGEAVLVPAGIGVDLEAEVISPLHTHQPSGIIHVEANDDSVFTLAQVLTEWGIKPDQPATVYVNGEQQTTGLDTRIRPSTEIALVFGTPPAEIPSTYDCKRSPQDACDKIPQPQS